MPPGRNTMKPTLLLGSRRISACVEFLINCKTLPSVHLSLHVNGLCWMYVSSYCSLMPVWFVSHFMEGNGEKGKGEEEIIDGQIHTGQVLTLCNIPEFSCCAEPFYSGKISGKEWDNEGEVMLNVFFFTLPL
uniref:Uncharacterized protein n=1 Tax=Micrurus spixii TaxID=129469 RepID=A0A2D4MWP0_9SAUR